MAAKRKVPQLSVVFDTSVLYTQVASDLFDKNVQALVQEHSSHRDLEITWHLPKIVVGERKHQMFSKAKELLPNMYKLERLLGHSFALGEDSLEVFVDKAIKENICNYRIKVTDIDTSAVDWTDLIHRSVNRKPPFQEGEKEKGFRDSIIAQSFAQLLASSPKTPNICRLAFVSSDKLLRDYVSELSEGANNVRICENLQELENLINTLVSSIPEELVNELALKAAKIFFESDSDKSLYYKEGVKDKILELYEGELSRFIGPGREKKGHRIQLSKPIFVKKEGQRIHWMSLLSLEFTIYHFEYDDLTLSSGVGSQALGSHGSALPSLGGYFGSKSSIEQFSRIGIPGGGSDPFGLASSICKKEILDYQGRVYFEVYWSTNLTQEKVLRSPKVEDIQHGVSDLVDHHA